MVGAELPDRALLVEGHELLAQTLQAVLRTEGVEVDSAGSEPAGTLPAAVRDGAYDLVLLDVDGWAEPSEVRSLVKGLREAGSRVVILSTEAVSAHVLAGDDVAGVIDKGQDFASLRATLLEVAQKPR